MGNNMDFSIQIPTDEKGYVGRECPEPDCEGYFKVVFGTGLEGEGLCPASTIPEFDDNHN